MVNISPEMIQVFAALGDPTRLATVVRLAKGPASVGELAAPFEMTPAGFSKHLRVLCEAGLVEKELDGRRHQCRLRVNRLRAASDWLATYGRFWSDGLEAYLDRTKGEDDR